MTGLTEAPLELGPLMAHGAEPEHGGLATFLGMVRREQGKREVVAIVYEAYEELALAELAAVCEEAGARFGARVAAVHRTGRVEVGEPSVAAAASAPHRPAAFAACRFVIDELKVRAPIWKLMVYADGASAWLDGREARLVPAAGTRGASAL
jgi:molybdopterin synthase catalytic subunit